MEGSKYCKAGAAKVDENPPEGAIEQPRGVLPGGIMMHRAAYHSKQQGFIQARNMTMVRYLKAFVAAAGANQ